MTTQYDDIGASYNEMRKHPASQLIDWNLQLAVAPFIQGAKVLDLACGTGIYSNMLMSWGASRVVGIDVSSTMVDFAKANTTSKHLDFEVGDCSVPQVFGDGNFDVVVAAWLLNYAGTKDEMINMYRTIAMNLKDGGTFIGITPHPTEDPRGHTEKMAEARPVQRGEITVLPRDDVADGVGTHLVSVHDFGNVEFDAYHLKKDTYETAARDAGLNGKLEWNSVEMPDSSSGKAKILDSYFSVPYFGILTISKE